MQCIIFAAGKGTRLQPLTLERPKPLIPVAGKPILAHIIEALPPEIDEIIVVVNYLADQIKDFLGDEYSGIPVKYIDAEIRGTAYALAAARGLLRDRFLVLPGDDLHGSEALRQALKYELALIVSPSDFPERFGVVEATPEGTLKSIIEKPERPLSNLVSTGAMVLDQRIFDYEAPMHENGEYYMTDMLQGLARDASISVIEQPLWIPIGYPEDITNAEALLSEILVRP